MTREYRGTRDPSARPVLICFSHLRWNFVYQRPQHLLSRAQRSYDVYFIEEPDLRDDLETARLDRNVTPDGVEVITPQLPRRDVARATDLQRDLLDAFVLGLPAPPRVLWYYTPAALDFTDGLCGDVCVFDCMDELSAFRGASPRLCEQERELLGRADLLFVGGRTLFEAKQALHADAHLFPSSVDVAHFSRARAAGRARASATVRQPRLGYFGVIDERMDLPLVDRIAELRPDWQLNMIGPLAKIQKADLPRRDNIHWHGPCSYEQLPERLGEWDLGIMPFALNEATRFISPTKTPEFLAAGLPVVSTPVRDVVDPYGIKGLVAIAATAEEFVSRTAELLVQPQEPWLSGVDAFLADMSWDKTWRAMSQHLSRISDPRLALELSALGMGGPHV
jgi:glycosyltransferase involved in cell wall biosynthesis